MSPSSALPSYAFEFTPEVLQRFEPYIGNENLVRLALGVLARRRKRHPVLVGEAGVGKTALVVELARRIAAGQAPDRLNAARVFQVDLGTAVAGTRYRGDFEERMSWLSRQLLDQEKSIFFIDEVHLVLNVGGGEGGIDAASLLKPALSSGLGALIGATTREQARHLESDAPLARRLVFIPVSEPSTELTKEILSRHAAALEEELSITVPAPVVDAALDAAVRLRPHRHLPDSAIDILELAVSLAAADTPKRGEIEPEAIRFVADFMSQGITTYANKGRLRSASKAVGRFVRRGRSGR
ncbi:MAG TPA: AAA family ATPase [Acidimicrobiia bacterium]|nr:AAA family ATPase [Acidimicrobiia bacterium]